MQAVIIDRDGVINHDRPDYVKSPEECCPIDGSIEAIARLSQAGLKVFIASNQSGLAKKLFDYDILFSIHHSLAQQVELLGGQINGFFFCPYLDGPDRKPQPGLLLDIATRAKIDLSLTPFIGDTLKDIQAAYSAQAIPMLVRTGKGQATIENNEVPAQVPIYDNLYTAVDSLLEDHQ
jgi:D-glycero-D-manno-heptose 1,7-bisphosphate phosphatase